MRNAEIAAAFRELGALYELDGANRFRVLAYKEAARVIADSPQPVGELAQQGKATAMQGIGDTIQEKIVALLDEGEIPAARKLKEKFPASLVDLTRIPGVGAKTVRRVYDETGIATLEELQAAAEAGELRGLKGLGAKFEENVLTELGRMDAEGAEERRLLADVREAGTELVDALLASDASEKVVLAGSARRWTDTCKDIDIVATASDATALATELSEHPLIAESGNPSGNGLRARTHNGIALDLRIVPPDEFGNLLQHFTGSKEHNVKLRERAVKMGLSVSEHGIADVESGEVTTSEDESGVYERLGLAYIEPELRQGRDEIAAAEDDELPELVTLADLRGDLHCHTTLSDGKNTLDEMAEAARSRGYSYLAITDHSATHGFGDDVQPDQLRRRIEEVAEFNEAQARAQALQAARRIGGQHPPRRLARLRGRAARPARLGGRQHPYLVPDQRRRDDRTRRPRGQQPARRLPRPPHRAAAAEARALRHRHGGGRRRGGGGGDDDRDQRQPEPPRPQRPPRPPGGGGGRSDRLQHRRPSNLDAGADDLLDRDRPAGRADRGAGREHADLDAAPQAQGLSTLST